MSFGNPIIIIDDDAAVRDSLAFLLETHGYTPTVYESGEAFLQTDYEREISPILMDVRMPGRSGIQVLEAALAHNPHLQIIIMSGHADIPLAVRALKLGAVDFIEKPFQSSEILAALDKLSLARMALNDSTANTAMSKLTPRETEIAHLLVDGLANKAIAHELNISVRTVETHRAKLLSKLDIKSLSDLVKLILSAS